MAYPGERTHKKYTDYVIRYSMGEEGAGKKLSKPDWLKRQKARSQSNNALAKSKRLD